jgi:phospholipid/cholesterol/gamma-HCH transport system substrate-binding protein
MAKRNLAELSAGAIVLAVAVAFLGYAVAHTGRSSVSGTTLNARFDHIDGLAVGSDVRMAGVKVGSVSATTVDPQTYQAVVRFTVDPSIKVPTDSSAEITSDGMLGGKYLSVSPGGSDKILADGGTITITQGSVSLEQLLGKFIFSVSDLSTNVQKSLQQNAKPGADASGAAPAPAPSGGLMPPLK